MAYNYQIPNYCPMCSSCLSTSHNNVTPCYSQYNCDQYLPYHYYQFPSNLPEQTKPSTDKRKKLTRSQSSCCISREACRGKPACAHNLSSHKCCSSFRAAVHHRPQERRGSQPQSRDFPASSCDINRLMEMVRDPQYYSSSTCDSASLSSLGDSASSSFLQPKPTRKLLLTEDGKGINCSNCGESMNTIVTFKPPASCLILVKRADQQRQLKIDRQVQCCFDISSDFCSCSQKVCELCAKKIVCTCSKIRCCMCSKLKSTADRKMSLVLVCKCPQTYKRCEIGSFLRFNSSPALGQEQCDKLECASCAGRSFTC